MYLASACKPVNRYVQLFNSTPLFSPTLPPHPLSTEKEERKKKGRQRRRDHLTSPLRLVPDGPDPSDTLDWEKSSRFKFRTAGDPTRAEGPFLLVGKIRGGKGKKHKQTTSHLEGPTFPPPLIILPNVGSNSFGQSRIRRRNRTPSGSTTGQEAQLAIT